MNRAVTALVLVLALGCRKEPAVDTDPDRDGAASADDCDPYDPLVAPGAAEVCNGRDDDCDGTVDEDVADATTWYLDGDGDGFGDDGRTVVACTPQDGAVAEGGDCDDADAAAHPGAYEDCSSTGDVDCDGTETGVDDDGDGFAACDDCDDDDKDSNPDASETCDGVDEDCDGAVDDDASDASTWYVDLDGDGVGSARFVEDACEAPDGFVDTSDDCDDLSAGAFPGASEACNGKDDDCDGTPDDGATDLATYFADTDSDGYGDKNTKVDACSPPTGYVTDATDCDDTDWGAFPGAPETCSDVKDRNCDGAVGQADGDLDGTPACSDCDDTRADVNPAAPELCDGVDNNCDKAVDETAPTWYADIDGDGRGGSRMSVTQCNAPTGFVGSSDDCDDLAPSVVPGGTEACNGRDDDCSGAPGTTEVDADTDGVLECGGDCVDSDAKIRPGMPETCDNVDQDCDGTTDEDATNRIVVYTDADNDTYGKAGSGTLACSAGTGTSTNDDDCNDGAATTNPAASETCDSADNDCNGVVDDNPTNGTKWYQDLDRDGVGSAVFAMLCGTPAGYSATTGDCDDTSPAIRPSASEVCNGVDDNCNSTVDENPTDGGKYYVDADSDGFGGGTNQTRCAPGGGYTATVGGDCADTDATQFPGNVEVCDTKDNNCSGAADENPVDGVAVYADGDGDGFGTPNKTDYTCGTAPAGYVANARDCDDTRAAVSPSGKEACNGLDDDCDDEIDWHWDNLIDPASQTVLNDSWTLGAGADYTVSFWIYTRGTQAPWTNLFHHGNTDAERNPAIWYYPGSNQLHIRSGTTADANQGCDQAALTVNTWTHLAVVKDVGNLRVYYNGTQVGSCPNFGNTLAVTAPVYIGDPWYGGANALVGDVRIQCRAEPAAAIAQDIAADGY